MLRPPLVVFWHLFVWTTRSVRLSVSGLILANACSLKRQSACACAIGEGLNAAMIFIAAAIENNRSNANRLRFLGNPLADSFRGLDVAARLQRRTQIRLDRRGGGERMAGGIVDQLRIDMLQAARHVQAGPLRRPAYFGAHALMPLFAQPLLICQVHTLDFLSGFPLALDCRPNA